MIHQILTFYCKNPSFIMPWTPVRQPQRRKAGKIPKIMQRCNFRFHKIIIEGTDITVLIKFKAICQGPCANAFICEPNNIWLGKKETRKINFRTIC